MQATTVYIQDILFNPQTKTVLVELSGCVFNCIRKCAFDGKCANFGKPYPLLDFVKLVNRSGYEHINITTKKYEINEKLCNVIEKEFTKVGKSPIFFLRESI